MISEVQYYLCHHEEVLEGGTLSIMSICSNLKRGGSCAINCSWSLPFLKDHSTCVTICT